MAGQVGCLLQGGLAGIPHEALPEQDSPVVCGLPTVTCFSRPSEGLLGSALFFTGCYLPSTSGEGSGGGELMYTFFCPRDSGADYSILHSGFDLPKIC